MVIPEPTKKQRVRTTKKRKGSSRTNKEKECDDNFITNNNEKG